MELLNGLLEITIYSGIIFAVIMLFKALLKDKMSPALHLAVWLVLLARLMLPVTFESATRFFVIPAETAQEERLFADAPATDAATNQRQPAGGAGEAPGIWRAGNRASVPDAAGPAAISWRSVLLAVWVAGIGVHAVAAAYGYRRLMKKTKRNAVKTPAALYALFNACKAELGIRGRVKLSVQRRAKSPALLFPSTILVPANILRMEQNQIKMALMHELAHYKRKDQFYAMLLLALRVVYWFNPVIRIAEVKIRDDMEAACDSMVVKRLSSGEKRYYAHTLMSICPAVPGLRMALGMALGSTRKNVEQRIRGIYMKQKSKTSVKIAVLILACVLGVCCFTTACAPTLAATPEAAVSAPAEPSAEPSVEPPAESPEREAADDITPAESPETLLPAAPAPDGPAEEGVYLPEEAAPVPEEVITDLTEHEVGQAVINIIRKVFGADVAGETLHIPDLSEPLVNIDVTVSDTQAGEYLVSLDPKTGALVWADKSFGPQVKGLDDVPDLDEADKRQDKQKVADIAVERLNSLTGANPKAYFVDAVQALFDANDSILTDCHVLLDNGEYYVVSVIYPGYDVGRVYAGSNTDVPFPSTEQLEEWDLDVMKIY